MGFVDNMKITGTSDLTAGLQGPPGAIRNLQEQSGTFRNLQEPTGNVRSRQEPSGAVRNLQEPSGAIRNLQEPPGTGPGTTGTGGSDGQLQLGEVPLVHVVVSHQLIAASKLLLTVGPPAVKGLLT